MMVPLVEDELFILPESFSAHPITKMVWFA